MLGALQERRPTASCVHAPTLPPLPPPPSKTRQFRSRRSRPSRLARRPRKRLALLRPRTPPRLPPPPTPGTRQSRGAEPISPNRREMPRWLRPRRPRRRRKRLQPPPTRSASQNGSPSKATALNARAPAPAIDRGRSPELRQTLLLPLNGARRLPGDYAPLANSANTPTPPPRQGSPRTLLPPRPRLGRLTTTSMRR